MARHHNCNLTLPYHHPSQIYGGCMDFREDRGCNNLSVGAKRLLIMPSFCTSCYIKSALQGNIKC